MKRLILAWLAALVLGGCQAEQPMRGTVLSVQETDAAVEPRDPARFYEEPLAPGATWSIAVRLDDGAELTVTHKGARRYEPGARVRLVVDEGGALLL